MQHCILALNVGSSSVKFSLFDESSLSQIARGNLEEIGESTGRLRYSLNNDSHSELVKAEDHHAAISLILDLLKKTIMRDSMTISAIGHRVVHGGNLFHQATQISDEVQTQLNQLASLAPLHNPNNVIGIELCHKFMPDVPQIAVFDTAYHQTMPEHAYRYAVPEKFFQEHAVRRYGFHGISHQYVAKQAAKHMRLPVKSLNAISLHLGAGASITAIEQGKCVDTSMGMTPLAGLMMATRCGDIDPAIVFYLSRKTGLSNAELERILTEQSGFLGICGESDMRQINTLMQQGDKQAQLAFEMFCYQIKKIIGAYYAILRKVDVIIFTGGIGEHNVQVRETVCQNLSHFGIILDPDHNLSASSPVAEIQSDTSEIKILVIASNEELEIAQETKMCLQ